MGLILYCFVTCLFEQQSAKYCLGQCIVYKDNEKYIYIRIPLPEHGVEAASHQRYQVLTAVHSVYKACIVIKQALEPYYSTLIFNEKSQWCRVI